MGGNYPTNSMREEPQLGVTALLGNNPTVEQMGNSRENKQRATTKNRNWGFLHEGVNPPRGSQGEITGRVTTHCKRANPPWGRAVTGGPPSTKGESWAGSHIARVTTH